MGNGKTVKNARCTAFDDANEPASVVSWKERANSDPLLLLLLRILRYGDTLSATNSYGYARAHTCTRVLRVYYSRKISAGCERKSSKSAKATASSQS